MKKHLTIAAALAFAALFLGSCDLIAGIEGKKDEPTAPSAAGYRIVEDMDHASITLNPSGPVFDPGTVVTVTVTPDEGYAFCGWTSGISGTLPSGTVTVGTSSVTVAASIQPRWTALVHVAADNNIDYRMEPSFGPVSNYLATLEAVKAADTFNVMDIFVLLDGYDMTDPIDVDYTTTFTDGYYQLTGGPIAGDLVKDTGEFNSGSVAVTKAFMDYAMARSKSKRTFYSVFNHGSGFDDQNVTATFGIGFDDSANSDSLSHNELAQVTAYLKTLTGHNIDVFFPYACLMGGVELAWEVRNNADVLVASEEVFPAETWSWEALAEAVSNPSISSLDLGKAFCDDALDFFSTDSPRTFTLATVDLSKIGPLYNALDSFAKAAVSWIGSDQSRAARFDAAAETALYMSTPYYTDISQYMDRINADVNMGATVTAAIPAVKSALSDAVTSFTTYTNTYEGSPSYAAAGGLSIFEGMWMPQNYGFYYNPATYTAILEFGKNNSWASFAAKLESLKVIPVPPDWDEYEPDNDPNTAGQLVAGIGNKQLHTFSAFPSDIDYDAMIVNLTANQTYTFQTMAATEPADTYMALFDSGINMLISNDDIDYANGNYYSKFSYTPTSTGSYYLVVMDRYAKLGDYYVYFDQGTWGNPATTQYRKWTPQNLKNDSVFAIED